MYNLGDCPVCLQVFGEFEGEGSGETERDVAFLLCGAGLRAQVQPQKLFRDWLAHNQLRRHPQVGQDLILCPNTF